MPTHNPNDPENVGALELYRLATSKMFPPDDEQFVVPVVDGLRRLRQRLADGRDPLVGLKSIYPNLDPVLAYLVVYLDEITELIQQTELRLDNMDEFIRILREEGKLDNL